MITNSTTKNRHQYEAVGNHLSSEGGRVTMSGK